MESVSFKQHRGLAAKIERKSFKSVQSVVVFILQKVELNDELYLLESEPLFPFLLAVAGEQHQGAVVVYGFQHV